MAPVEASKLKAALYFILKSIKSKHPTIFDLNHVVSKTHSIWDTNMSSSTILLYSP